MFKVAIIGAEYRGDYKLFVAKCKQYLQNKIKNGIIFYSFGDRYVDIMGRAINVDVVNFNANWKVYGNDALKMRNLEIIDKCDAAIIFEDGTKSTNYFISMIRESDKPYRVVKL